MSRVDELFDALRRGDLVRGSAIGAALLPASPPPLCELKATHAWLKARDDEREIALRSLLSRDHAAHHALGEFEID